MEYPNSYYEQPSGYDPKPPKRRGIGGYVVYDMYENA